MFPTEERIRPVLEPIEEDLCNIILPSLDDTIQAFRTGWLFGRSPATIMNDLVVQRARAVFAANPEVRSEIRFQTGLFMKDFVVFKFKKAKKNGISNNFPTALALAYHDPSQENLFGIEDEVRTEVNYVTDKSFTAIERILVGARDGKRLLFAYPIYRKPSSRVVLPAVITVSRRPPEELVRPRRKTKVSKRNSGGRG